MNIPIRQLKKWIAALDSGDYKQGTECLQDTYGYCCLGVGCKVLINKRKQNMILERLVGNFPEDQPNAPQWLKEINSDFQNKTGTSLDALNDIEDYTFPEIATLLELVYIHKMLD